MTRVLAAGDHFVAPRLFDAALRAEPGLPGDLDVAHLTAGWPTEPFGPVGTGDSTGRRRPRAPRTTWSPPSTARGSA